jgi:hypothetical protein
VGTALLARCEAEARAGGFSRVELMATLPGVRLYAAHGYASGVSVEYDLGSGLTIEIVPMRKSLLEQA